MTVRLSDVAARVGVSEATVSRVLNNRHGVSAANRRLVLAALEVLGYERPARPPARRAGLVGLIVPELDNPVFPMFAQALEATLVGEGFTPVLCAQAGEGVHEDQYVRMLLESRVAGIVFVSGIHANVETDPRRYTSLRERDLPIVLVNGFLPGVDAPFLSNDDAAVVDLALRHLTDLGHRRIGLAAGPERYLPVRRRVAAFLAAGGHEDLLVHAAFTVDGGADATGQLLDRGASAVIFGSDLMAMGAVRVAHRRRLRIPHDLSVVGSDDILLAEFTGPGLTTVRQPVVEMARAAADALLGEIAGRRAPRAEYMFAPELVVRASTAPSPGSAVWD